MSADAPNAPALALRVRLSADSAAGDGAAPDGEGGGTDPGDADPGEPPGEPSRDASDAPSGASLRTPWVPDEAFVGTWARRALDAARADGADPRLAGRGPYLVELSVHLADTDSSRALNREHRGRDRPTNVLSFPSGLPALPAGAGHGPGDGAGDAPDDDDDDAGGTDAATLVVLGDLVPCPEVIRREAAEQAKDERAHWAHLIVHGTLHLLGLDHEDEPAAAAMEAVETGLLAAGGWPDPYRMTPDEAGR